MFKTIQSLMPKAATKMGIGKEFQAIQICVAADKILHEIYPQNGPYKIRSKSFQKGLLTVSAPTSASSQDITMRKDHLIEMINHKMGRKVVKELRTMLSS